ncbi:MAG: response regulator [Myxococcota bacterium]
MPTVLVVDDDPQIRELLRRLLTREGWRVLEACHGEEALLQMQRQVPDLCILDVDMPVLDGLRARRRMLEQPALQPVPVLMMSGSWTGTEEHTVGILTKPFTLQDVVTAVAPFQVRRQPKG